MGRHAILAALERGDVAKVTVITEHPELLDEANWECGCPGGHTNPARDHPDRVEVVTIGPTWDEADHTETLKRHFEGAAAVVSCLGHRQPGWRNRELLTRGLVAASGNRQVVRAMEETPGLDRAVVMSSIGIQEDWPPLEFHLAGKAMGLLFKGPSKKAFKDLNSMELAYKKSSAELDYLFVRPAGLTENVVPEGKWFLQEEKGKDKVGIEIAKMDVARFMIEEALAPTRHRTGVVIGGAPPQPKRKSPK